MAHRPAWWSPVSYRPSRRTTSTWELGGGVTGVLHVRQMSSVPVEDARAVLAVSDCVTALAARVNPKAGLVTLSTKLLEPSPGKGKARVARTQMLTCEHRLRKPPPICRSSSAWPWPVRMKGCARGLLCRTYHQALARNPKQGLSACKNGAHLTGTCTVCTQGFGLVGLPNAPTSNPQVICCATRSWCTTRPKRRRSGGGKRWKLTEKNRGACDESWTRKPRRTSASGRHRPRWAG